jgi:predicted regulator of Ras-like GTPase activity (Roadblock/LC7/MglB family)
MTSAATISEHPRLYGAQLRATRQALLEGMGKCDGMYGALLCTIDGHEVAEELRRSLSESRLAAMNSSILALAETLAAEAGQKQCRFVILENGDGRLVTVRVNQRLLLTCIADQQSNLGVVLKVSQVTAATLAEILADF